MPLYTFTCPSCKEEFDRLIKLSKFDDPVFCDCGAEEPASRKVCAPFIQPDYAPYDCPITGKRIEGRKEHEANLRAHGCRVLESGETRSTSAAAKASDEAFFDRIAESAAETVAAMPPRKQEQLANELSAGADVVFTRS